MAVLLRAMSALSLWSPATGRPGMPSGIDVTSTEGDEELENSQSGMRTKAVGQSRRNCLAADKTGYSSSPEVKELFCR